MKTDSGLDTARFTAQELLKWARSISIDDAAGASHALKQDPRRAAQAARLVIEKRLMEEEAERKRLLLLYRYEQEVWSSGLEHVAGVDEAGRGPLAGPVVAAAVILRKGTLIRGLDDSKRVPGPLRERLYDEITDCAVSVGVGTRDARYIEEMNIAQASFQAMRDALSQLTTEPQFVLVDGFKLPGLSTPQKAIVKGDALSNSIAAASIIAKVTRDRIMDELDKAYPQYGFAKNRGYTTKQHLAALDTYGLCAQHRRTFTAVVRAQLLLEGVDSLPEE